MAKGLRKNYWTDSNQNCNDCGKPLLRYIGEEPTETFLCVNCNEIYMTLQGKIVPFKEWFECIKERKL